MTLAEFTQRRDALALRGRSVAAAQAVLVEGRSISGAARDHGLHVTGVRRVVHQIRDLQLCPSCQRPM